jgi:hypothetical protein
MKVKNRAKGAAVGRWDGGNVTPDLLRTYQFNKESY